jgi:hypothetical protein
VEAWAGAGVTISGLEIPEAAALESAEGDDGYEGEVQLHGAVAVAKDATPGPRAVSLLVRYRACGAGACRPETAMSLHVPITVEAQEVR